MSEFERRHRLVWNAAAVAVSLAICGIPAPSTGQGDPRALIKRLSTYRFGSDRAVLEAIEKVVQESRTSDTRRVETARALGSVLSSDTSFDAKQFACRQLVLIATEEQAPQLAAQLKDDQLASAALLALARIPGGAVDTELIKAMAESSGRTLVGVMDTLAERGSGRAAPAIAKQLNSTDPAVHEGAARALGKLGDLHALAALRAAFERGSTERRPVIARALLAAAARIGMNDRERARSVYELLDRQPVDTAVASGALRGLVLSGGARGFARLEAALKSDGSPLQRGAAMLVGELPDAQAARLLAILPSLTPAAQTLVITAFAQRAEITSPGILALVSSPHPEVRLAAIRALSRLGGPESVSALLKAASAGTPEERPAARQTLSRLREADSKLLDTLGGAEAALQVEAIRALAERRYEPAIPRFFQAARGSQPAVRTAALRALREMGGPSLLPALLDLLAAAPAGERDEILETAGEIARRGTGEDERTGPILSRLPSANAADRTDLLRLLGQVGGSGALASLRTALKDPAPEVRLVAYQQLAEWPTDEAMPELLAAARTASDNSVRGVALRGYVRMIGLNEQRSPVQALALYKEASALANSAAERRLILSGLPKHPSLESLQFARSLAADPEVRAEGELAVVEIGRRTAGAWRDETRAALEPIAGSSENADVKKGAAEALALIPKFGDYITAWEVSPVYSREGVDYSRLFDTVFPPEAPSEAGTVPWRLMPAGLNREQPWLMDLLALTPGDQKAAYLRTAVWSESARDLVLELGSDDGIKAWWNGQQVLANNTARAVAPAQEKVKVAAKPGWNHLLLKITQNVMGWSAVARLADPDGSPATGLRFALPSTISP